jgi:hypothetical protein
MVGLSVIINKIEHKIDLRFHSASPQLCSKDFGGIEHNNEIIMFVKKSDGFFHAYGTNTLLQRVDFQRPKHIVYIFISFLIREVKEMRGVGC